MLEREALVVPAQPIAKIRRKRGRPLMVPPEALLEQIRRLAARGRGLFRVHRTHGALYARARRLFGSWEAAVRTAGVDYSGAVDRARQAALETRRRRHPRTSSGRAGSDGLR